MWSAHKWLDKLLPGTSCTWFPFATRTKALLLHKWCLQMGDGKFSFSNTQTTLTFLSRDTMLLSHTLWSLLSEHCKSPAGFVEGRFEHRNCRFQKVASCSQTKARLWGIYGDLTFPELLKKNFHFHHAHQLCVSGVVRDNPELLISLLILHFQALTLGYKFRATLMDHSLAAMMLS